MLARKVSTKELVWTFINAYYGEEAVTPNLKQIEEKLKLKKASLKTAIKGLQKEQYIRITMNGTRKFIIITRLGKYRT